MSSNRTTFFFSWIIYLIIFIIAIIVLKLLILPNQYLVKTSVEIFQNFIYTSVVLMLSFLFHTQ